jgi:CheY-like chemotaxis protein
MSGKKLLVADDSLTIQKVIRLALSHEGYEIQAVSDGPEAMEQLMLFRPQIVLIDVSLPGKSAVEVKTLADERPELRGTRFVLMSSAFEPFDENVVDRAGFHGRLTKPFDPAHLRKVLSDCLESASDSPAQTAAPQAPLSLSPDFGSESEWETASPATPSLAPSKTPSLPSFSGFEIEESPAPLASPTPLAPPSALPHPGPLASPNPSLTMTEPSPSVDLPSDHESDIRQLTQSTLKMAGIDDLGWTLNEGAKKDLSLPAFDFEPSLPPLPKMTTGAPPSVAPMSPVAPSSSPAMKRELTTEAATVSAGQIEKFRSKSKQLLRGSRANCCQKSPND